LVGRHSTLTIVVRMRNRLFTDAAICLFLLFFSACSTQKNTWGSRHYHDLTTRYNVYFNGNEAYKQGLKQIKDAHKEDFSRLLPVYTTSNQDNAKNAASNMNRCIEKCQKAIKRHSIRVKPAKKPDSKSSPEKKEFYSKEEFNPFMDNVFMLMANAQFHKADYLSATATCSYIIRHFQTDKITSGKAGILMARAYTEMGWQYDAENAFNKLNKDNLSPTLSGDFSKAYADFLIRQKKPTEAIPYLEIAIRKAIHQSDKQRLIYLLAQIYQETSHPKEAYKFFGTLAGMNPPYEMELSARIRQTEVYPDSNPEKPLKKITGLSRSSKNSQYLDQIYYAMGNLYFAARDTAKAIESLQQSLNNNKGNNSQKIKTLLRLGAYYYQAEQFLKAEPCYTQAATIIGKADEEYPMVAQHAEVLRMLAPYLQIIHDEDSLQRIAQMPEMERQNLISERIKAARVKIQEEKHRKETDAALAANEENMESGTNENPATEVPSISSLAADQNWYFYNPATISRGLAEFQRKWGKRSLKDDWRRDNKTALFEGYAEAESATVKTLKNSTTIATMDSAGQKDIDFLEGGDDPLHSNFYLKNLPLSESLLTASNKKIAEALYQSAVVFREQMENDKLALKTFRELERRFPDSPLLEKSYYMTYLMLKQHKRDAEAETDRKKQITLFPKGDLAKRLDDPLFIEKLAEMSIVQDSLYEKAYQQYLLHHTDSLVETSRYVEENYPISPLLPRFAFLEAMEAARTGKPEDFHRLLKNIVDKYPQNDLLPTVNQMLAFWDEGRRPVASAGYTNLLSLKSVPENILQQRLDSLASRFQFESREQHVLLISYPADSTNINRLQFDVALYNFTHFLIRDYELSFAKVGNLDVLLIRGFENAEDVMRYRSWINFQNEKPEEKYRGTRLIMVSESNLKLLEQGVPIEKYLPFMEKMYSENHAKPMK